MELHQLEYVIAVIDHGGFTRAADALGVSQPSLSQGVRKLEAELGVELFHRVGRGVTPTAAGEAFAGPARDALLSVRVARHAVAEVADLVAGRLDLVALPTLAVDPLAALVGAFRMAHPGVAVHVLEPNEEAGAAQLLRGGRAEVGLVDIPVADAVLVAHPLMTQDMLAVCPPGTAFRRGHASIRDLAVVPVITTLAQTSTRAVLDDAFAAVGLRPLIAVELTQRDAIGPLVASGAGWSILPRALAESAAALGAAVAPFSPPMRRTIGIVHRPGPLSPAAQAFVRLAARARH